MDMISTPLECYRHVSKYLDQCQTNLKAPGKSVGDYIDPGIVIKDFSVPALAYIASGQ